MLMPDTGGRPRCSAAHVKRGLHIGALVACIIRTSEPFERCLLALRFRSTPKVEGYRWQKRQDADNGEAPYLSPSGRYGNDRMIQE